jgi:hypothetical protein
MADWPNVMVPNHIGPLLDYIKKVNRPPKMSREWLASGGFRSSNDRYFIGLFKALGYIDGSGAPTDKWAELKGSDVERKASVGRQMAVAYPEIFAQYPRETIRDSLTKDELKDFVRPKITAGEPTVVNIVATFWALKTLASFDGGLGPMRALATAPMGASASVIAEALPTPVRTTEQGLSVTINLSLEIPPTSDPAVYDKLFESMAKHLGSLLKRAS